MPGWLLSSPPAMVLGVQKCLRQQGEAPGISPACVPTHKAPPTPNFKAPMPCAGPTWGPLRPAAPRLRGGEHPAAGPGAPRGWQAAEISYQQMSAPARGCASGSGCSSAHSWRGAVAVLGGHGSPGGPWLSCGAVVVPWQSPGPRHNVDSPHLFLLLCPFHFAPRTPQLPPAAPPWVTLPRDAEVTLSTPHPHPVATAEAPPGGFF